jgi:hypothetical protein
MDCLLAAIELDPENAVARETGGETAHRRADASVPFDTPRERCVVFEPIVGRHVNLRGWNHARLTIGGDFAGSTTSRPAQASRGPI